MILAIAMTLHNDPAKTDRIVDQASPKNGGRVSRGGEKRGLIYGNDLYFSCIDSAPLPWAARWFAALIFRLAALQKNGYNSFR